MSTPKSPKQPKATKIEMERRIVSIQEMILNKKRPFEIIDLIVNQKQWCKSDRHAERLIKDARERWAQIHGLSVLELRQQKVEELEALIKKMGKKWQSTPSGITTLLRVQGMIIKLQGLNAPVQVEVSGKEDGPPIPIEAKHTVDMSKLPTDILKAIISARIPNT